MGRTTEDIAKTLLEMQPDSTLDQIELTVEEACQLGKDYIELLRKIRRTRRRIRFQMYMLK